MSNPSDNRSYFESIQNYFLERTGRGLVISSRDLELLIDWQKSGATSQTVCRGIDEAVDTLREVPRDLHAVRRFVEPRLRETVAAPVFTSAAIHPVERNDPWEVALDTLTHASDYGARPELSASYLEVARRIREARAEGADPWAVLFDLDDFLVRDAFGRLAEDERRLIDLEIEGQHGVHLGMMSEEAREQTLLESRRKVLQSRWRLPNLTE